MNAMLESAVVWLLWTGVWWAVLALGLALWFRVQPPQTAAVRHAALAATIVAGTLAGLIPRWGSGVVAPPEAAAPAPGDVAPEQKELDVVQNVLPASLPDPAPAAGEVNMAAPGIDVRTPAVIPVTPLRDWLALGKNMFAAVWVLGSLFLSVRLIRAARMTLRWRREAAPLPDGEQAVFVALRQELRVRRATRAGSHTEPASPVVLCGWPPLVLVPSDWPTWEPESRYAAWRHELAHVRRRDDWWRMLSEGLRVLWWFHPGVRWLLSRREHEAELLSDEAAVAAGCPPQELAQVLLDACRRPQSAVWTASAGTFFSPRTMKQRIARLLDAPSAEALCRPAPRGLRLAAFAGMTLLALAGSIRWIAAANSANAAGAVDLAKLERKIAREPRYHGKPMYCLLVFGKIAEPRWLVLDIVTEPNTNGPGENVAYFDRDGDGDLTRPGNRIVGKIDRTPEVFKPVELPKFQNPVFNIGDVVLADGTRHTEFVVNVHHYIRDHRQVELSMKRRGKHWQGTHAPESALLRLGATPRGAPVVHFDGPVALYPNPIGWIGPTCPHPRGTPEFTAWCMANPSVYKRKWMVSGTSFQMEAVIGTPGSGAGTFVRLARSAVPNGAAPHAEIALPDGRTIQADLDVKHFETRDTLYRAEVAIPADTPPGKATVAMSFPDWPDGPEPATDEIEVEAAAAAPVDSGKTVPAAEKPKGAEVKLTPEGLIGAWRGTMDDKNLMLSFHRPPVESDVQLDIHFGGATIGSLAAFTIAPDGGSASVVLHSADSAQFGTLRPGEAGTLKLELIGREQGQTEVMLTRDADAPANEPRQKEARELFDTWKHTANDDGTIPGTFIGKLATEVRAYVKAKPNLDSGMKLPKLLPRFVTSRDWTQAEAIKLLDDVAYYSTAPIEARVAKAKLPSSPLWRTEVEFVDIPVQIAKWSEPLRGLRVGVRVVETDWRVGRKARMELWLHNAGTKDVTFKTTGPDRQDVGVAVAVIGADGREHWSENGNVHIIAIPLDCTLPAGHVAMVKKFEVTFVGQGGDGDAWFAPRFRGLEPGRYKLRCVWLDAAGLAGGEEWKGTLTAPEVEFTLSQ